MLGLLSEPFLHYLMKITRNLDDTHDRKIVVGGMNTAATTLWGTYHKCMMKTVGFNVYTVFSLMNIRRSIILSVLVRWLVVLVGVIMCPTKSLGI